MDDRFVYYQCYRNPSLLNSKWKCKKYQTLQETHVDLLKLREKNMETRVYPINRYSPISISRIVLAIKLSKIEDLPDIFV